MFLSKKAVLLPCLALSILTSSACAVNNPQPVLSLPEFQFQVPQVLPITPSMPNTLAWGEWIDETSYYAIPIVSVIAGTINAATVDVAYTSTPGKIAARAICSTCVAFLTATALAIGSRFIVIACGGGKN